MEVSIAARPGVASLHLGASDADSSPTAFADFSNPQSFSKAQIAAVKLLLIPLLSVKVLQRSISPTTTRRL
ncbi:hypothetical protein BQ8794_50190 [Mesorhizobium prunaredense]|uniref:Uncharacterized protein n=1 Tax=Mesorhizobium prunaredense TaxID=1631249 RepID=A0A1R3VDV2_9HYPH|nr:hypothetical protein BQ8794_50190 [Mesorhizobium prunaredense]